MGKSYFEKAVSCPGLCQEPAEEADVGDGKSERVAITDKTQAGNTKGFFHSLPPGVKAAAARPHRPHQGRRLRHKPNRNITTHSGRPT